MLIVYISVWLMVSLEVTDWFFTHTHISKLLYMALIGLLLNNLWNKKVVSLVYVCIKYFGTAFPICLSSLHSSFVRFVVFGGKGVPKKGQWRNHCNKVL